MVRPPRELPAPRYGGDVGRSQNQDETATMVVTKEQIFDKNAKFWYWKYPTPLGRNLYRQPHWWWSTHRFAIRLV